MPFALPWFDRAGRFAPLKAFAFFAVLAPGIWISFKVLNGTIGVKPVEAALHETGLWAVRLLLVTLAITPLRLVTGWGKWLQIRRMLGVAALTYTLIHLTLYVVQQKYDLIVVAREIVLRFYLTVGFASLAALIALGLTSTDRALRNLGPDRWNRLHQLVYPLTVLAIFHAFLQAKIDVSEEVIQIGIFLVLMAVRMLRKFHSLQWFNLLGLAILSVPVAIGLEALWYGLVTGVPWRRVLMANFDLTLAPRPAFIVGMIALILPVLALFGARPSARPARRASAFGQN